MKYTIALKFTNNKFKDQPFTQYISTNIYKVELLLQQDRKEKLTNNRLVK